MKKIRISLIAILGFIQIINAQNNTFPASGNVGIGTITPETKLEITQNKGESQGLKISHPETPVKIYLNLAKNTMGEYGYLTLGGFTTFRGNGAHSSFQGNLGVGIDNPQARLHVLGDAHFGPQDRLGGIGLNYIDGGIEIASMNDPVSFIDFKGKDNLNADYIGRILYEDGRGFQFSSRVSGDILSLRESGNVGIGTRNPDEKLTVNGTVHAKEVKVDLQIPADYVFQKYYTGASLLKPEYKLPALEEIEAFTRENHHLPGIPSAEEIQKNGFLVGKMSNLLLQKIEELTLYTLEQENKIKNQDHRLQTQEGQIEEQEERLKALEALLIKNRQL